jgi:hypothetical protein
VTPSASQDRFWSRVDRSGGPTACWAWTGGCASQGYGVVRYEGRVRRTHSLAYELVRGALVEGLVVRHLCHERSTRTLTDGRWPGRWPERRCCNPAHLELGTVQQNAEDRARAGRGYRQRPRSHPTRRYW